MFIAVFNEGNTPVDLRKWGAGATETRALGAAGQAAFLSTDAPRLGADVEKCGIHELGGRFWLVGRVRLDARRELRARLAGRIGDAAEPSPDALLCLHAYAAWGDQFAERLAGDFSFVLWDEERQEMTGVRDQMGVRRLFHARAGNSWIMSDSPEQIVARASIGRDLDDNWIADFLTLGFSREFERTVYRDIRRLAPGHAITAGNGGVSVRRYWRLNIVEPLHLRARGEYGERFRELVSRAVADRLPAGRVGIAMSGGLDSTTLAACAVSVTQDASRVVAECDDYEEMMHIGEGHFASLAARRLGIDLSIRPYDNLAYDAGWQSRGIGSFEPTTSIINAHFIRQINDELAARASVWLEGEGPDNALTLERNAYLTWLLRRRSWSRLATAAVQYAVVKGCRGWAQTLRRYTSRYVDPPRLGGPPRWLNRDFALRLNLEERIRSLGQGGDPSHPWRPMAMASFTSPIWQDYLDDFNFYESLAPVARRHPYLDLRVLEFMLSVPPVPWGWKKRLVREAMRDRLPAEVLAREKTPLPVNPTLSMVRRLGLPDFVAGKDLASYVDVDRLPGRGAAADEGLQIIAASAFDYWLMQRGSER